MTRTKCVPNLVPNAKLTDSRRRSCAQRGQGMTEYIIIVALIAVAAIAVYQIFGTVVRSQTAAIASEVGGVDGTNSQTAASTAARSANAQAVNKGLSNYAGAATAAGTAAPAPAR